MRIDNSFTTKLGCWSSRSVGWRSVFCLCRRWLCLRSCTRRWDISELERELCRFHLRTFLAGGLRYVDLTRWINRGCSSRGGRIFFFTGWLRGRNTGRRWGSWSFRAGFCCLRRIIHLRWGRWDKNLSNWPWDLWEAHLSFWLHFGGWRLGIYLRGRRSATIWNRVWCVRDQGTTPRKFSRG